MKSLLLPILVIANLNLLAQEQVINQAYQKGTGKDGVRVGEWNYFDSQEELDLTYDYESNTVSYLKLDSSNYLIYDNGWKVRVPDRQPRYIGSYAHLYDFFAKELSSIYKAAAKKNINTIILLELEFNEQGRLIEKNLLGENKQYFKEPILEIAKAIPEYWIPALYNGTAVKAKIAFPLIFTNNTQEKKQPKVENLEYEGKIMPPIKIVAYGY